MKRVGMNIWAKSYALMNTTPPVLEHDISCSKSRDMGREREEKWSL